MPCSGKALQNTTAIPEANAGLSVATACDEGYEYTQPQVMIGK